MNKNINKSMADRINDRSNNVTYNIRTVPGLGIRIMKQIRDENIDWGRTYRVFELLRDHFLTINLK